MVNQLTKGASLKSIEAKTIKSLMDTISIKYSGKVIYIDFWAPWFFPCLEEMPYSNILQQEFKNKDLVFLFLASQCEEDSWKATIANKKLTGEHILLTTDQSNILAGEFNISTIPHYVLIDKKGNVVLKNASRPSEKVKLNQRLTNC